MFFTEENTYESVPLTEHPTEIEEFLKHIEPYKNKEYNVYILFENHIDPYLNPLRTTWTSPYFFKSLWNDLTGNNKYTTIIQQINKMEDAGELYIVSGWYNTKTHNPTAYQKYYKKLALVTFFTSPV